MYIFGRKPVIEALNSDSASEIEKIYLKYGTDDEFIRTIRNLSKKKNIKISTLDKRKFSQMENSTLKDNENSQGIIAQLKLITTYTPLELAELAFKKEDNPIIAILEEINDPHNLGAIARSAECSGIAGILITQKSSAPITSTAMKTSAGALNHIHVAETSNLSTAIKDLKNYGFWIAATDMKAEYNYYDDIYDKPTAIIIGNEGRGISQSILNLCDLSIKIPIIGKTESLNASVSAAIIFYEAMRQKLIKG